MVAKELARDLPQDSPHRADVELLLSQSERCRTILTELSTRPEAGDHFSACRWRPWSRRRRRPYRAERVRLIIDASAEPGSEAARQPAPQAPHSPELVHGLGNLLQNAIEFARSEVRVTVRWSERRVSLKIRDDGPGFAPGLLDHLGEPYLSGGETQGRIGSGEHMGLGIFIAQTLLDRTGAQLSFGNGQDGGAEVTIAWNRSALESDRRRHDEVRYDEARSSNAIPGSARRRDRRADPADRRRRRAHSASAWRMAMERRGYAVRRPRASPAGIAAARQPSAPAFAVVDLRLTDGSGLDIVTGAARRGPTAASSC